MELTIIDAIQSADGSFGVKWRVKPEVRLRGPGYKVISQGVLNDQYVPHIASPPLAEKPLGSAPSSDISDRFYPRSEASIPPKGGAFYVLGKDGSINQKWFDFKGVIGDLNFRFTHEVALGAARIIGGETIGALNPEQRYMQNVEELGRTLDIMF